MSRIARSLTDLMIMRPRTHYSRSNITARAVKLEYFNPVSSVGPHQVCHDQDAGDNDTPGFVIITWRQYRIALAFSPVGYRSLLCRKP